VKNVTSDLIKNEKQCVLNFRHSSSPLIRPLVIRIANYPDWLGPSGKHFRTVIVLHFLGGFNFSPNCQRYIINYVFVFYLYVNKFVA